MKRMYWIMELKNKFRFTISTGVVGFKWWNLALIRLSWLCKDTPTTMCGRSKEQRASWGIWCCYVEVYGLIVLDISQLNNNKIYIYNTIQRSLTTIYVDIYIYVYMYSEVTKYMYIYSNICKYNIYICIYMYICILHVSVLTKSKSHMPLLQHFLFISYMSNIILHFWFLPGIFALEYLNLAVTTYIYSRVCNL